MTDVARTADDVAVKRIAREISEELESHPERWFQGALVKFATGAMASTGYGIDRDDAICWCLEGHIYKHVDATVRVQAVFSFLEQAYGLIGTYNSLNGWNDAPGRTVEDVIELCKKVAA